MLLAFVLLTLSYKLMFTFFDVHVVDVCVCWRLCLLALMPLCC